MRRILLTSSLIFVPAVQAVGQVLDGSACADLFKKVGPVEATANTVVENIEGGCRVLDAFVRLQGPMHVQFDELTLTGEDVIGALSGLRLPPALDVKGTNVRMVPVVDDPVFDYVFEQQAIPYDVTLSLRWDQETRTLDVDDFSLASPYIGRLAVEVSLLDVGIEELSDAGPESMGQLASARILLEDRGLFAAFALAPLAGVLPRTEEGAAEVVERHRQTAKEMISALPSNVANADTKGVLRRFIDELPRPTGIYMVDVTADPAISFDDLEAGPFVLLDRLTIEADYTAADIGLQSLDMD